MRTVKCWYNRNMESTHPKSVRRRILEILYEAYIRSPHEMLAPQDILEDGTVPREDLLANAYYLHDRGLVELMTGYNPPSFAAARITANGIDLVENRFEFNLRFPPEPGHEEAAAAQIPALMERLVEEADFSPLDGDQRRCLLRDIQYLRDELARPIERWRPEVVRTAIRWIDGYFKQANRILPSLSLLRVALNEHLPNAGTDIPPPYVEDPIPFPKKD